MSAPKKSASATAKTIASTLFQPAQNNQAYLKAGLLGFGGSGKSLTSFLIAVGLVELLSGKKDKLPILYTDSETGSDFFVDKAKALNIPLLQLKTRAFDDLSKAMDEAKRIGGVHIVDSVTHFWLDLCSSYMATKKRSRLYFQDWGPIKDAWYRDFASRYVMDPTHTIMAGRAAFEYDYNVDASGEKQLEKTGTKMKAEGEMGYEPSLLIEMVREPKGSEVIAGSKGGKKKVEGQLWDAVAYVLKDRWGVIHGSRFINPTFDDFLPHVSKLNLGGQHFAFGNHDSQARFANDPEKAVSRRITDVKIALEEIQGLIVATAPGQSAIEKAAKAQFILDCFGTRSWTAVETMRLEDLIAGLEKLKATCAKYLREKEAPAHAG